jgi:hypothetical protein
MSFVSTFCVCCRGSAKRRQPCSISSPVRRTTCPAPRRQSETSRHCWRGRTSRRMAGRLPTGWRSLRLLRHADRARRRGSRRRSPAPASSRRPWGPMAVARLRNRTSQCCSIVPCRRERTWTIQIQQSCEHRGAARIGISEVFWVLCFCCRRAQAGRAGASRTVDRKPTSAIGSNLRRNWAILLDADPVELRLWENRGVNLNRHRCPRRAAARRYGRSSVASCRRFCARARHVVRRSKDLAGLLIEQQMVVAKMRTRDVPVEVLVSARSAVKAAERSAVASRARPVGVASGARRRIFASLIVMVNFLVGGGISWRFEPARSCCTPAGSSRSLSADRRMKIPAALRGHSSSRFRCVRLCRIGVERCF